jgi:hypothetical protein
MSNMREILDLINEMSEEEGSIELMDSFDIELGEDLLVETGVIDFMEDGIVLEGDDRMLELLSEHGLVLEETDWSKYDEPTVSRIKKGVTKPVDKTDYDKPTYQRKKEKEEEKEDLDEAEYQGRKVPLGKPMAGDVKKSKVYVKGPKGNVVKVNFGDKKMRIKKNIPGRRKNFRARHNCDNPGPRWKARYWSCRAW